MSASQPAEAHDALVADLAAALAPDRVRTGAVELGLYGRDASVLQGSAAVACFPLDTAEVAAAVRIARQHGRPFVARGSGTGLAGGAVPVGDPVVIVTTKMDRILEV
ncbi:MAG TPA: FAD-binding protein, partial [Acidimicrobiales bacterium]|nr:FAD-binding protein [Acidimicrobiales bacterium]